MHGVQPNANATPTSIAPSGPAGLRWAWTRFSVSRNASRKTPIVCSPKMISTTPAILLRSGSLREEELADRRRGRAERDEHEREADDEGERGDEHLEARRRRRRVAAHLLDRDARDERDVAGDQRQYARRHERQEACRERRDQRDVRIHLVDLLQPDGRRRHRRRIRPAGELHRRQILEHDIPFPALGRVRRLQPVLRRHGTREGQIRRVAAYAGCPRASPAPRRRGRARCWCSRAACRAPARG